MYLKKCGTLFLLYRVQYRAIFDCVMSRIYSEMMMMMMVMIMMTMIMVMMMMMMVMSVMMVMIWEPIVNKPSDYG